MKSKFNSREVNIINNDQMIFIIGMCPGKQRKKDENNAVFHGNRTGDFIEHLIRGINNLYLTNIFNYYVDEKLNLLIDKKEVIDEGVKTLNDDINKYKPIKIILLGAFAKKHFNKISFNYDFQANQIFEFKHPSYILRFNKSKKYYEEMFRKVLK